MSDRVEVETLKVGEGGGRDLLADLYRPPNPNGCGVLLIYGGGFVEGDRRQLAGYGIALGRAGYTSLACEYRLAGEALWPAALEDVHTALERGLQGWPRQRQRRAPVVRGQQAERPL